MIASLNGVLAHKSPGDVVIDVHGVGYQAHVSLRTFCGLPDLGERVHLYIVTNLRENALELFGFAQPQERALFQLLRGVTGIGPKLALTILSGIDPDDLVDVLREGTVERLVTVPGVGRKTAERMVVDLKGKVETLAGPAPARGTPSTDVDNDAVLALVALGYKQMDARRAVTASRNGGAATIETLIKRSLSQLG
jgi:Holliday junction DNA helicase RuvA